MNLRVLNLSERRFPKGKVFGLDDTRDVGIDVHEPARRGSLCLQSRPGSKLLGPHPDNFMWG
eukprot:5791152-Amphidinium_carterae.1